jgi:CheY-like chemotaxis protein
MARILSISYDETLLSTRQLMLEAQGHKVSSALGFATALKLCRESDYDLLIMGHSIPSSDKEQIIKTLRLVCKAPVLALLRATEPQLRVAEYNHELHGPEQFLHAVNKALNKEEATMAKYAASGQVVAISGIYRVIHPAHREHDREQTFTAGNIFPNCPSCSACEYVLLKAAPAAHEDPDLGPKKAKGETAD